MVFFNLFSNNKSFNPNEFETIRYTIVNELRPYLKASHLTDEAAELYSAYANFLTSIVTGVMLKMAYQESKNLSNDDKQLKSIFKIMFEECINFQEKFIITNRIEKDEILSSVNFKRLHDRRGLLAFLSIKENEYMKELKEGIRTQSPFLLIEEEFTDDLIDIDGVNPTFTSTVKKYPTFLQDIFCVRIEETTRGIRVWDEEEYNIDWDNAETFFMNLIQEYKFLYRRYKS